MIKARKLLMLLSVVVACVLGTVAKSYSQSNNWQATLHAEGQVIGGAVHLSDAVIGIDINEQTIPAPPPPPEYTVLLQMWRENWIGPYYQDIRQEGQLSYQWQIDLNPHGNVPPPPSRCAMLSWSPSQFNSVGQYSLLDTFNTIIVTDMRVVTEYQVCGTNQSQYFIISYSLNRAPILNPIGPKTVLTNQMLAFADTASDPDGAVPILSADSLPQGANFADNHNGTGTFTWTPGNNQAGSYHVWFIGSDGSLADSELVAITVEGGGCVYIPGDANGNGAFNGLDVTYSVNYFKGGAAPPFNCECTPGHTWFVAGDVNNSCSFNGLDVTYMVNYFKGGAAVIPCADCPPGGALASPEQPARPAKSHTIKPVTSIKTNQTD